MRRRDNQHQHANNNGNRDLRWDSGAHHHTNLAIDNIPSRIGTAPWSNTISQKPAAPTPLRLPRPLLQPAASERWRSRGGNQYRFSTQAASAADSTSDDDVPHSEQTTVVGWNSHIEPDKKLPPLSQLEQDSYSPTEEDEEALEEAWSEYTSSQSQSQSQWTDFGFSSQASSQVQDGRAPSSTDSYGSYPDTASLSLLLPPSPPGTGNSDGETAVIQDSSGPDSSPTLAEEATIPSAFRRRLGLVWPRLPAGLQHAPLPVVWEIMRAALYCSVNPADLHMLYEENWLDQGNLWASLKSHPAFERRKLPDMCDARAWNCSVHEGFQSDYRAVVLAASMSLNDSATGPALLLELLPLQYEKPCRLHRRFGSDRFLDLRLPALDSWSLDALPKEELESEVVRWLTNDVHPFLGRSWSAFYVRNERRKQTSKDSHVDRLSDRRDEEKKPKGYERISFFAVDGVDFLSAQGPSMLNDGHPTSRVRCTRDYMLNWLLQFDKNEGEPYLKFFSRVSLGQTKANPVIHFQEDQIRHHSGDILSPDGKTMNDGIGRISPSVMRKIRDELGLTDTPCAVQARIGSAKGMWITDVTDTDQEDWIETYASQRKWECDWSDEYHRTLEVKSYVGPLRPANLNLQFLPIMEDGAVDKRRMRNIIGNHLEVELGRDLESMKTAIKHPELFRQWAREASTRSSEERISSREVPFLGGLPNDEQDKMAFLADGGFDPMQQKYLQEIVFLHQRKKCQMLEKNLKIRIARSTYAFMVVDFLGVLAPDEVHLSFSSKFGDGVDECHDLDGIDVLVARAPAHLPSDIQKVRAVFKPELRHLKDVIIFPRTGMEPLADKLSGGDYDGDKAWVCWEPEIVNNFESSPPPPKPKFPLPKDTDKVERFLSRNGGGIDAMLERAFAFIMRPNLLGMCTSHKEKLSYHYNSISHKSVVALSWLLSDLADQAKSGIIFNHQHWQRFRNRFIGERYQLPEPAYKGKMTSRWVEADHIIDHLRFVVAKGLIDRELASLTDFYNMEPAHYYDADVANYWNQFEMALGQPDRNGISRASWFINLKRNLRDELVACLDQWLANVISSNDFRSTVMGVYDRWRKIEPRFSSSAISTGDDGNSNVDNEHRHHTASSSDAAARGFLLRQSGTHHPDLSNWQLLKASMTFSMFGSKRPNFTWQIAGRQLQFIKAMKAGSGSSSSTGGVTSAPIPVVPNLYAALRPDNKYIKRVMAGGGGGSGGHDYDYDDYDGDDDHDVFVDAEEDFVVYPDLGPELAGLEAGIGGLKVR